MSNHRKDTRRASFRAHVTGFNDAMAEAREFHRSPRMGLEQLESLFRNAGLNFDHIPRVGP